MNETEAVHAACKIRGACAMNECRFLHQLSAQAPAGAPQVELGTLFGRTAYVMGAASRGRVFTPVFTIDNFKDEQAFGTLSAEEACAKARENLEPVGVQVVMGDTRRVPGYLDRIGLLFIDSYHRRDHLYAELDAWLPLLVKGGVVAMHDYDGPKWNLKDAIDERFMDKPEWEPLGKKKWLIAFRRVE